MSAFPLITATARDTRPPQSTNSAPSKKQKPFWRRSLTQARKKSNDSAVAGLSPPELAHSSSDTLPSPPEYTEGEISSSRIRVASREIGSFWSQDAYVSDDEDSPKVTYGDRVVVETLGEQVRDWMQDWRERRDEYRAEREARREEKKEQRVQKKVAKEGKRSDVERTVKPEPLVGCRFSWKFRAHRRILMLCGRGREGQRTIDIEDSGEIDFREIWRMSLDGYEEVVQEWVEYACDPEDDFAVGIEGYRVVYPRSPEPIASVST